MDQRQRANPSTATRSRRAGILAPLTLMLFLVPLFALGCSAAATPDAPAETSPAGTPTAPLAATTSPQPTVAMPDATGSPVPTDTPEPTNTPAPAAAPTEDAGSGAETTVASGTEFVIQAGARARYLIREQLASLDFPNDAIGETGDVSGSIIFDAGGGIVSPGSKIVVDLRGLRSDSDRRDGYVRNRSLQTDTYPNAEFIIREAAGLPWPLPAQGEASFQLLGDMTVHGVTRPLTWDVAGSFDGNSFTGQAKTNFTFEEFEIDVPRVRVVLSVDNDIRLEVDFTAAASP